MHFDVRRAQLNFQTPLAVCCVAVFLWFYYTAAAILLMSYAVRAAAVSIDLCRNVLRLVFNKIVCLQATALCDKARF